jgi:hypothetical protein
MDISSSLKKRRVKTETKKKKKTDVVKKSKTKSKDTGKVKGKKMKRTKKTTKTNADKSICPELVSDEAVALYLSVVVIGAGAATMYWSGLWHLT